MSHSMNGMAGRGDWIRTSDLHSPSVKRYPTRQGGRVGRVARRRRKSKSGKWVGRFLTALLAVPALYLIAALVGSLLAVNNSWSEPADGTTIYIADNGIHADLILPVKAQGLDWAPVFPKSEFANAPADAGWIAFGSGEKRVYLDTPTWWDIRPRTVWSALVGGKRVMHVEYVPSPYY